MLGQHSKNNVTFILHGKSQLENNFLTGLEFFNDVFFLKNGIFHELYNSFLLNVSSACTIGAHVP